MANFATAEWYLTDQKGNGSCFFCADTIGGYHSIGWITRSTGRDEINDPAHTSDAEQQLLFPWLVGSGAVFALLAAKIARLANVHAILHIVLFTELPPCGQCSAFFDNVFLPTLSAMASGIMSGFPGLDPWPTGEIGIQFDVFAKDPAETGGDWRVVTPDLIEPYYKEVPFLPPGTA